jgi:hypothetical protein
VEWVATVEAVEVPAIGWLLAASSCTDGEKVVRGGSQLQRKMQWRGDAGKVEVRRPYRRRSRAQLVDEAAWHSRTAKRLCGFRQVTASGGSRARRSDRRCRDGHGAVSALWRWRARTALPRLGDPAWRVARQVETVL